MDLYQGFTDSEKDINKFIQIIEKIISIKTLKKIDFELLKSEKDYIIDINGENNSVTDLKIDWNESESDCILYNIQKKFPNLSSIIINTVGYSNNFESPTLEINEDEDCIFSPDDLDKFPISFDPPIVTKEGATAINLHEITFITGTEAARTAIFAKILAATVLSGNNYPFANDMKTSLKGGKVVWVDGISTPSQTRRPCRPSRRQPVLPLFSSVRSISFFLRVSSI